MVVSEFESSADTGRNDERAPTGRIAHIRQIREPGPIDLNDFMELSINKNYINRKS